MIVLGKLCPFARRVTDDERAYCVMETFEQGIVSHFQYPGFDQVWDIRPCAVWYSNVVWTRCTPEHCQVFVSFD